MSQAFAFSGGPIAGWLGAELGNQVSCVEGESDQETCRDFPIWHHRSETTTPAPFEDAISYRMGRERLVKKVFKAMAWGEGLADDLLIKNLTVHE